MNFTKSGRRGPVPVGSYAPNGFGLHDMAGNVQEWVADRYGADYYRASPAENPPGPETGAPRRHPRRRLVHRPGCMGVALPHRAAGELGGHERRVPLRA